jgi:hypothetical protein
VDPWDTHITLKRRARLVSETDNNGQLLRATSTHPFSYAPLVCFFVSLVTNAYLFEQAAFGSITGAIANAIVRMIMRWISRAYDLIFGCRHRSLSRVFSIEGNSYKVCCQCGAKFPYSWESMHMIKEKARRASPKVAPVPAKFVRTTAESS